MIPVVDLFAGPGGLGEGFAACRDRNGRAFRLAVSIEKDPVAHRTLRLRAFFRQFERAPSEYYQRLRRELDTEALYARFPEETNGASEEAQNLELRPSTALKAERLIAKALRGRRNAWVLLGGPPCQAYSLAGRSRIRGADPDAYESDGRHFLYREYLRILRRFRPPVFIMENVKGILSSTVDGKQIFARILADMKAAGYALHSFTRLDGIGGEIDPQSFLVRCEEYGIPQARHRVLVLGIREGLERGRKILQPQLQAPTVADAIGDLPRLRSSLSRTDGSADRWMGGIQSWKRHGLDDAVCLKVEQSIARLRSLDTGDDFIPADPDPARRSAWLQQHTRWFLDGRIGGVTLHSARSHMESDLHRYLFASCFAQVHGFSPRLRNFPRALLPDHANAEEAAKSFGGFSDRFRVQQKDRPASTVVSHISKDGHYYIHYDPVQCRSLTVREAARLQTFPDNYLFEGNRTQQYVQVGNAVPPLLARQLAEVVHDILSQL